MTDGNMWAPNDGRPVVHYVTAWKQGDIGGGLNRAIAVLPDDDWVCVRDGDSMFLTPHWGDQIEQIVAAHGSEYDVIGAMTNRLGAPHQLHDGSISNDGDIGRHVLIAERRWADHGTAVARCPDTIAAMCMIFSKRFWLQRPFDSGSIVFDSTFTGCHRCGVALGLYVFHLYRWGAVDPRASIQHLL